MVLQVEKGGEFSVDRVLGIRALCECDGFHLMTVVPGSNPVTRRFLELKIKFNRD